MKNKEIFADIKMAVVFAFHLAGFPVKPACNKHVYLRVKIQLVALLLLLWNFSYLILIWRTVLCEFAIIPSS